MEVILIFCAIHKSSYKTYIVYHKNTYILKVHDKQFNAPPPLLTIDGICT